MSETVVIEIFIPGLTKNKLSKTK